MAKGTHLTPEVKSRIAQTYLEHPDYGPTKVREELLKRMKEDGLDRNFGPDWPGVSAVGKVLTDIRQEESKLGPDKEDRPWSVSALADNNIPPEAFPVVMKAWAKALEDDRLLTIRQVKWIARLYSLHPDLKTLNIDYLIDIALEYANQEQIIKLTGAASGEPQDMRWLWFKDATLYLGMTGDDSVLRSFMRSARWQIAEKRKDGIMYLRMPAKFKGKPIEILHY